jgi:aminoglycoside phosphotransferase (APT) family kinase protein
VADDVAAPSSLLAKWFAGQGIAADVTITGRAAVGLSQDTWFLQVELDGTTTEAVLRCPTPASGRRAIHTQIAALRAVAGTAVPAPKLLWHDEDVDNAFGRPFFVMTRASGQVPVGWSDLPGPERDALAVDAIDVLATLHTVDPGPARAVEAQAGAEWYGRQLAKLGPTPSVVSAALWWLERHEPPPAAPTLVHGDFRMGNLVVEGGRVVAVLDWEMAARGDPIADLAWCFIPVWELAGVDETMLIERYAIRSGRSVDPQRLQWHRVLAMVRLTYYTLSGANAFDSGRSNDLRLAALRLQLPIHLDRLAAAMTGEAFE